MAAKLTFIKKLVREEVINTNQLIINSIFGSVLPNQYDEQAIYNKGEVIINPKDNNAYELLVSTKDGVTGPFNKDNWSPVSFTEIFKDSSVIVQNNTVIKNAQEGMANDLATLVYNLAGLLDDNMEFSQIYRENFKTMDNVNLINGDFEMGYIESNNTLEFTLINPKILEFNPEKFKLKHFIELVGTVAFDCELSFNAMDSNPYWFNINDAILDSSFFEIPDFVKEEGIPYALNMKIKCTCENNSNIKISDLMVVFI